MANLNENDQFDSGVYQWETTDAALGGPLGVMNKPLLSLVNRTRYLLGRLLDGVLNFVGDSGAKNALVIALPQPVQALADGMKVAFRVLVTNDAAATLKLTNTGGPVLPTLPIYGGDQAALIGSEMPAGSVVEARLNTSLNVGNGGAWVIEKITGGYANIPTAPAGDMTKKAANMAAIFAATDGRAVVDVSGSTDTVLTQPQYGLAMLTLTGAIGANKNLIFPAQSGQWIVENDATGAFSITAKTAAGTGVILPVGVPVIVCSDGVNVKFASAGGQASMKPYHFSGIAGSTVTIVGGYTPGAIIVERNGGFQEPGTAASPDYTATDGSTVNFTVALTADEFVTVWVFATFNVANAVAKSGDAMGGPLALYVGSTMPTPAQDDNSQSVVPSTWVHALAAHGQCRLSVVSATSLKLSRYNGACLNINGTVRQIPAAGVTISNGALAASSVYYVYAFMNAGVMTLELSATTHATNASGVEIKSGDATRTLVGMIATNSSGQFVDSPTQRFCLNWFHRRALFGQVSGTSLNTTATAIAEVSASIRISFLSWADEAIFAISNGEFTDSTATAGQGVVAQLYLDGAVYGPAITLSISAVNQGSGFSSACMGLVSEGVVHTTSLYGYSVYAGTATYSVNNDVLLRG